MEVENYFLYSSQVDANNAIGRKFFQSFPNENKQISRLNFCYYSPLHVASSIGDIEATEELLKSGFGIEPRDKDGNDALLWASKYDQNLLVQMLIEKYGANPNLSMNFIGENPLHVATCNENAKLVEMLLYAGANPNRKNYRGETPLHYAAALGSIEIVELLIKKGGAWLECEDEVGDTPLHFSVREGQIEAASCLLCLGANPLHQNEDDESPSTLARDLGDNKMVRIFRSLGGGSTEISAASESWDLRDQDDLDGEDLTDFDDFSFSLMNLRF